MKPIFDCTNLNLKPGETVIFYKNGKRSKKNADVDGKSSDHVQKTSSR